MNVIAPGPEPRIREIPLSRLSLAPENVRKTPPDARADAELKASIAALGLLENLVVRTDEPSGDGIERYAVVAGGRRLKAMQALAAEDALDADHPVPCLVKGEGVAPDEISLAENVVRIAMHPADQVVALPHRPSRSCLGPTRNLLNLARPDHDSCGLDRNTYVGGTDKLPSARDTRSGICLKKWIQHDKGSSSYVAR